MQTRSPFHLAVALSAVVFTAATNAQPSVLTYQGQFAENGVPANGIYDFVFTLHDSSSGPTVVGGPLTNNAILVSNGLFTVTLDFGTGVFDGAERWLEIGAAANGGGAFTTLSPRQALTSTPYALHAGNAANLMSAVDAPLDIKVNGQRALRLEPDAVSPNLVGGHSANAASPGSVGVTIGGGGTATQPNISGGDYTVIAGGRDNTIGAGAHYSAIGGGFVNEVEQGAYVTVLGGGQQNTIQSTASFTVLGGGAQNLIGTNAIFSTLSGGRENMVAALAHYAVIGGGFSNTNSGKYATIPGGRLNSVGGDYGFAAGRRARADHQGAFVWADSTDADFASTAADQFSVRAGGGVRIETGGAGMTVDGLQVGTGIVASNQLSGVYTEAVNFNSAGNQFKGSFTGDGSGLTGITATAVVTNAWELDGNAATIPGSHFLGTTDNQPLEMKVNNQRAMRLEYAQDGILTSINLIGGDGGNYVSNGVVGATIGGGGTPFSGRINRVLDNFGTVGGGSGNTASAFYTTVSGGIDNTASGSRSTVGGGSANAAGGFYSTVGGGVGNQASADEATVGGGSNNMASGVAAVVGGGSANVVSNDYATVAGGIANQASADEATIGGGSNNMASEVAAVVGGGRANIANGTYATVGGGSNNLAGPYATVGGGNDNVALGGRSTIAGGWTNSIELSGYATICGGYWNGIGLGADGAAVAGGLFNSIGEGCFSSTIGGGRENLIWDGSLRATIGGGWHNIITNSHQGTVGGGRDNLIASNADYAVIPGGSGNSVGTNAAYAFAAGHHARALHRGSFVWADSLAVDFDSTAADQVSFRCFGGVRFTSGGGGVNQTVAWTPGSASWSFSSDRNLKQGITPVDGQEVLEKVTCLPICEWNYQGYSQRHIGPMAQDFHAAFPLNDDPTALNSADLHGVALAAIKGLNEKVERQQAELAEKEIQITRLMTAIDDLKATLEAMEQRLNRGAK